MIRVFSALPAAWADLTVHDFRTQGPFLLSAVHEARLTRWARLTSAAGTPCVVRHGATGPVKVRDGRGRPLRYSDAGDGATRIAPRNGDSTLITARGDRPDLTIAAVRPNQEDPPWGLPAQQARDDR